MEKIINLFLNGKTGNIGNLYIFKNAIKYIRVDSYNLKINHDYVLVYRTKNGNIFANSSSLTGEKSFRARNHVNDFENHQRFFCEKFSAIPFNVFKELNKNINDLIVLDQGSQENHVFNKIREVWRDNKSIKEKYKENFHFVGHTLIFDGEKTHLIDLDRIEIKNQIVNIFMATLNGKIESVDKFYNGLKPEIVKDYELKNNYKCLRQGEWFFVPCNENNVIDNFPIDNRDNWWRGFSFNVGDSTPNIASNGIILNDKIFVSGKIKHKNNEHKELILPKGIFQAIPNSSKSNLKLTGMVD